MIFNDSQKDTERGIAQNPSGPTLAERFHLFRDLLFLGITLLHLASGILAISILASPTITADVRGYMAIVLLLGAVTPILGLLGYSGYSRTVNVTSAVWFELAWTVSVMVLDFIIAVAHATVPGASQAVICFTFVQTISLMLYIVPFALLIFLHHRRFPQVAVWGMNIKSVQWMQSAEPDSSISRNISSGFPAGSGKKQLILPIQRSYDDKHEATLGGSNFVVTPISPEEKDVYVGAHPFWQERVQRQAAIEDDMAYIVQRFGLEAEANAMRAQTAAKNGGKGHAKRPSIRELGISKPIPVASTVRRAHTLSMQTSQPTSNRYMHHHTGSVDSRPVRRQPSSPDQGRIPSSAFSLDVPIDVISFPDPTASIVSDKPPSRPLGLASRTLVGTSRPKASGTRAHVDISKPLPSPPPYDGSDLSLPSSGPSQGSHGFVMAMAQRVKISASKVRPQMVSTPQATPSTPIDAVEYEIKF